MSRTGDGGRRSRSRRRGGGRGFTLVELLVAVGIVGVLVSLLLPSLSGAREQARRVNCLANLRTLTTAWLHYAHDHRGRLPSAVAGPAGRPGFHDWVAAGYDEQALRDGVVWPLVNDARAYRCPSDDVNATHTYAINSWLNGEGPPAPGEPTAALSLSRITHASETFVFVERLDGLGSNERSFVVQPYPSKDWVDRPALKLHKRAGMVSFADGHAIAWNWLTPTAWHTVGPDPGPISANSVDADLKQAQRWIGHGPYPP